MHSPIFPPIPKDTASSARSLFGRSNFYIATGDQANQLFGGLNLEAAPGWNQSTSRTRALQQLITVFQYLEALPDHLVPGALHGRLDWKYALHLPLGSIFMHKLELCEFRHHTLSDRTARQYFQILLARLSTNTGTLPENVQAHQVISRVCLISRVAQTWEAINRSLEALAARQPEWLLENSLPHWFERYDTINKSIDLSANEQALCESAQVFGRDGAFLLQAVSESKPEFLLEIPEIIHLKDVWEGQFSQIGEQIFWRNAACDGCEASIRGGSFQPH